MPARMEEAQQLLSRSGCRARSKTGIEHLRQMFSVSSGAQTAPTSILSIYTETVTEGLKPGIAGSGILE